ncbi:nucleotide-binding universal stress UspA family protein [Amycolatopsis sulphurea]|uniref:Nucleotide-binding universal stress UspA family protein n=1 Tax=Amycolatopsis sulphurea TaxID=76022 RepID=A0A2A9G3J1_9PSEU|nr:universal stress protein [Amycolatopsis sulphurea]PFG57219.1 nucleotide-binding universal stress UspA family protein [Amycolatopsis sulphurea]
MTGRGRTVLAGIDGSDGSAEAVRWAAGLAAGRGLELELLHCLRVASLYYGGGLAGSEALFRNIQREGDRIVAEARGLALEVDPAVRVRTEVCHDPAAAALIDRSRGTRMAVLGRTGLGGFAGMLVGGTTATVASHAYCPVTVVRGRHGDGAVPQEGPVVVGVDGSPNSEAAIAAAFEEASFRRAPLVAVHAWADVTYDSTEGMARLLPQWEVLQPDEERLLAERLAGWQEKYPDVPVERKLVRDRPRHILLDESARARLVVVGSRGRGGFTGMLLGSTSQALIQHAWCPVLVVRPER